MSSPHLERHFRAIAESAQDGILTVSPDTVVRYANPAIEDIFGYAPEALVDQPLSVLFPGEQAREVEGWFDQDPHASDEITEWNDVRVRGEHSKGHEIPLSISFNTFEQAGTTYITGIVRDQTEQQQQESRLTALNYLAQDLATAESREEVCEHATEAASSILDYPIAAIELYDPNSGQLKPSSWTSEANTITDGSQLFAAQRNIPWDVFTAQRGRIIDDITAETDLDQPNTHLQSAIIEPIGSHGLFIAGSQQSNVFHDDRIDVVNILVGNIYSALERVDREETLREQKSELQEKAASLQRVNRTNNVIRDLTKALTQASGRHEIVSEVCARLAASDPYRFAWFGSVDPGSNEVVPEASAGADDGYLETITFTVDDTQTPTARALRTRSPQIQNNIYHDPPFEPWRKEAIQRGYRASISVPVAYRNTVYGTLNVYAEEANVFDQMEIAVIQELGETIGYALNADERKQAFTSEQSIELTFNIRTQHDSLFGLPLETGGVFELENLIERRDGMATMFFAAQDQDPNDVIAWANDHARIHDLRLLTDRANECIFECALDHATVWAQLLQRGSIVHQAVATPDGGQIKIRIPRSADPRTYDALFAEHFDDVELAGRREYEEPVMMPEEFEAAFRERLTERQDEVLQTAYYAGYFAWPRETKSKEVADMLGIAQPTVSRHIRASEEKLLAMVYEDA